MKPTITARILIIVLLLTAICSFQLAVAYSDRFLLFYTRHLFPPLQRWRGYLLNKTDFSIGDAVYLLLGLFALLLLLRTIYYAATFKRNRTDLYTELLRLATFPLVVYLLFLVGWGGNYERPALTAEWNIDRLKWDKQALVGFNKWLLTRINEESNGLATLPEDEELNRHLYRAYRQRFSGCLPPLKVKATSLGYMLNYLGIQGYYNPLSGEGQFNRFIPAFMHPFVIAHEMAHQAGIAAEDDANLLAYIVCSESGVQAVRYSAHFNLFLYAFSELRLRDSSVANKLAEQLNKANRDNMEELRAMNRKYRSGFRKLSTSLYDEYLRLHGQPEGIGSYSLVTRWACFWEYSSKEKADLKVCP